MRTTLNVLLIYKNAQGYNVGSEIAKIEKGEDERRLYVGDVVSVGMGLGDRWVSMVTVDAVDDSQVVSLG